MIKATKAVIGWHHVKVVISFIGENFLEIFLDYLH